MSVWPGMVPASPALSGSEGALVSVSIDVDPRHLESLLEALARLEFPINPEIYHDASVVYQYADGHEATETTTLVEFPAYEARLEEVRRVLESYGFHRECLHFTSMLDEIQESRAPEAPAQTAPYVSRRRVKQRASAVH